MPRSRRGWTYRKKPQMSGTWADFSWTTTVTEINVQPKDKRYTVDEIENAWGIIGIPTNHGLTKLLDWFVTRNMQATEMNIREGVSKVTDLSPNECDQLITALRFSTGQNIDAPFAHASVETNEKSAKQSMLWYLAGPMTGYPDFNYKAFEDAVWRLRENGIQVISPHEINAGLHDLSQKESRSQRNLFLKNNISAMMICNGVLLLPGWEESKGVELELRIAKAFGMRILSLTDDYGIQDEQI